MAHINAHEIASKWIEQLGSGFHPDTAGKDYCQAKLSTKQAAEYDADMQTAFAACDASGQDFYAICEDLMAEHASGEMTTDETRSYGNRRLK